MTALTSSLKVISNSATRFIASYCSTAKQDYYKKINDVFIVGAGCIGQGLAVSLLTSSQSNRVVLISSPRNLHELKKTGITAKGVVEKQFIENDKLIISDKNPVDLANELDVRSSPMIFSTTKACDAVSSLIPFKDLCKKTSCSIICLQNGLKTEDELSEEFSSFQTQVLKGHVLGAIHKKEGSLFAYKGKILIENKNEQTSSSLKEIFSHSSTTDTLMFQEDTPQTNSNIFDLVLSDKIYKDIFPKIAVNCVCNPLTVIFNQNLGDLGRLYPNLVKGICAELYQVAETLNLEIESSSFLSNYVLDMMSKFSGHYSSMYYDHVEGKKTEISYINGGIISIAKRHKLHLPLNKLLTTAILDIETQRKLHRHSSVFYIENKIYLENLKEKLLALV